jgi:hypothetical protein
VTRTGRKYKLDQPEPKAAQSASAISSDAPMWMNSRATKPGRHSSLHLKPRHLKKSLPLVPRQDMFKQITSEAQAMRGASNVGDLSTAEGSNLDLRETRLIGEARPPLDVVLSETGNLPRSVERLAVNVEDMFAENNINLIDAFKSFDADASGTVTKDEFRHGLTDMASKGLIQEVDDKQFRTLVGKLDQDGDGRCVPFLPHSPSGGLTPSRSPYKRPAILMSMGGLRLRQGPRQHRLPRVPQRVRRGRRRRADRAAAHVRPPGRRRASLPLSESFASSHHTEGCMEGCARD